jgi:hypothetical protein
MDHMRASSYIGGDLSDHDDIDTIASGKKGSKKSKSTLETQKVAFGQNRARTFWHFLLFHSIPLTGAIALLTLNIQGRYWGTRVAYISLLQFVAKGHEMLMQASIGVVSHIFVVTLRAFVVTVMSLLRNPKDVPMYLENET